MMLARFRTAHDQFAAEEVLVMQFLDGALRLVHREHLNEGKALRTLVVFVRYHLGVLHRADAVEELEEIALRRIKRQVPDIEPGGRDFDRFRLTRRTRRLEPVAARRLRY